MFKTANYGESLAMSYQKSHYENSDDEYDEMIEADNSDKESNLSKLLTGAHKQVTTIT